VRIAVYARYSSENQSEKSIDDQVRVCRKYAVEHDLIFDERHIYADEAISGSIHNRPGLLALEKAMENKEFDAVAVEEQSSDADFGQQVRLLSGEDHLGIGWDHHR